MYSKVVLLQKNKEVVSRRKKAYRTKTMVDFSKDHKFELNGENVDDFSIKIQIKCSSPPFQKSKSNFYLYMHIYRLGQTSPSTTTPQHPGPVLGLVCPNLYVDIFYQTFESDNPAYKIYLDVLSGIRIIVIFVKYII